MTRDELKRRTKLYELVESATKDGLRNCDNSILVHHVPHKQEAALSDKEISMRCTRIVEKEFFGVESQLSLRQVHLINGFSNAQYTELVYSPSTAGSDMPWNSVSDMSASSVSEIVRGSRSNIAESSRLVAVEKIKTAAKGEGGNNSF